MKCPVCSTDRTRNAAATRQAILAAARRRFLEESYENVGVREISGDVGVDATLVNRYFGSKEQLFKEVLREGKPTKFFGAAELLPETLASMIVDHSRENDPHAIECLLIILRSASSPQASEVVARTIEEDMLHPLARLLDEESAELRAALALSIMIGTTVLRTILGLETIGECDDRLLHRRLADMFRVALAGGPLGCSERAAKA